MVKRNRKRIFVLCTALFLLLLCACGAETEAEPTPEPTPTATPEPTPVPTPVQDTNLPAGPAVTVDGTELAGGSAQKEELVWVSLREFTDALQTELTAEDDTFRFEWRNDTVSGRLYSAELQTGEDTYTLPADVMLYQNEIYVPVEALCDALEIGFLNDEEYSHLYCTPGAGSWELAEGCRVPVLMYHSVAKYWSGDQALNTSPYYFLEQIEWLLANNYTPIFFEDLSHVEDYENPVILTFDDGYENNYTTVYPILQEYGIKATFFIITYTLEDHSGLYITVDQLKEMQDSGLVSIQSHTVNHNYLDWKTAEDLDMELRESRLDLTRTLGKEPFVLSYPCGRADDAVVANTALYYRFAVRMSGEMYYTGADPLNIWRIGVYKGLTTELFAERVSAVKEPEA